MESRSADLAEVRQADLVNGQDEAESPVQYVRAQLENMNNCIEGIASSYMRTAIDKT